MSAQSSSNPSELSTPGNENPLSLSTYAVPPTLENVGQRVNVSEYAAQEWQGNTKKAKTILQVIWNKNTISSNCSSWKKYMMNFLQHYAMDCTTVPLHYFSWAECTEYSSSSAWSHTKLDWCLPSQFSSIFYNPWKPWMLIDWWSVAHTSCLPEMLHYASHMLSTLFCFALQCQLFILWSHTLCEYFQLPEISFLPFWETCFLK